MPDDLNENKKRRMTIYIDHDLEVFLREYAFEFEITTMNKAVIDVLEGAAEEWRCRER